MIEKQAVESELSELFSQTLSLEDEINSIRIE